MTGILSLLLHFMYVLLFLVLYSLNEALVVVGSSFASSPVALHNVSANFAWGPRAGIVALIVAVFFFCVCCVASVIVILMYSYVLLLCVLSLESLPLAPCHCKYCLGFQSFLQYITAYLYSPLGYSSTCPSTMCFVASTFYMMAV